MKAKKTVVRALAALITLNLVSAPTLQARGRWSDLRSRAQSAAKKTRSAATQAYRRSRSVAQQAANKAKDLWEDPRVRQAAGVAAAAGAAALGAYLYSQQQKKLEYLERNAPMQEVLDEVGSFTRRLANAVQGYRVNAELIGAKGEKLTFKELEYLAKEIVNFINRYGGLLESKVTKSTNNSQMLRQAEGYSRILQKLRRLPYGDIILQEMAYDIIGVPTNASSREKSIAYRKKILEFHPDKASRRGMSQDDAKDKTQLINAAYQLIK